MAASFSNIMKRYQIPIAQWSVQDVQEWLGEIGLGNLNGAIEHNAVSGSDLIELAQEDLLADLGATSIQARKVKNELAKMGAPVTAKSASGGGGYDPQGPAAAGYPAPGSGYPGQPGYPPPAGYQVRDQTLEANKPSEVAEFKRQLDEAAKATKMAEMERMMHAEQMKNDMRKEMDMTSRLAATEAAQRGGSGASPMVVSNNNNNSSAAGGGGGGGAGSGGLQASGPTKIVVREDDYCCCCW